MSSKFSRVTPECSRMDMNLCRLLMLVSACVVTFSCLLRPVHGQQDGGHGFHYTHEYLLSLRGSSAVDIIHTDFPPELFSHRAKHHRQQATQEEEKREKGKDKTNTKNYEELQITLPHHTPF